jgi:DNA-binding IclR family transcriptional regulator
MNNRLEQLRKTKIGRAAIGLKDPAERLDALSELVELVQRLERSGTLVDNLRAELHRIVRGGMKIERWYQERLNGGVPAGVQWPCAV